MQRLSEWESAFVELQKMFSLTQRDEPPRVSWRVFYL
ncbi:MbeD/MobD family mobilization/exclusion protein [Escherichia coli]|nr:MbeD/MobD family mobilization/exclusion protein [Escherichia coli]